VLITTSIAFEVAEALRLAAKEPRPHSIGGSHVEVLAVALFILLPFHAVHAAEQIGFREITIPDESRPLHVALWYPTEDDGPKVPENPVFHGVAVVKDATAWVALTLLSCCRMLWRKLPQSRLARC
jgi:hypothetical protein